MRFLAATLAALTVLVPSVAHANTAGPINDPVDDRALMRAVRMADMEGPQPPEIPVLWTTESYNGHCVGMEPAIQHFTPPRGWDVYRMSGIAYHESKCTPTAANSCCHGIFQIHESWVRQLRDNTFCGISFQADLYDPWKNVCAAAYVYQVQGIGAWSTA